MSNFNTSTASTISKEGNMKGLTFSQVSASHRISDAQLESYMTVAKAMVGVIAAGDDYESDVYTMKRLMGLSGRNKETVRINPIPTGWVTNPVCILLDERPGRDASLPVPSRMITALKKAGIPVTALAVRYDENRNLVFSNEATYYGEPAKKFSVMDPDTFDEVYFKPHSMGALRGTIFYGNASLQGKQTIDNDGVSTKVQVFEFNHHMALWLARQVESCPIEGLVGVLKELTHKQEDYDPEMDHLSSNVVEIVSFGYKSTGLRCEFNSETEVSFTLNNQKWDLNPATSMHSELFSAKTMAFLFLLSLTCGRKVSDKTVGGYLAACSSLWQVDNTTYGRNPKEDEVLAVVSRNTIKSVKAVSMNPMGDSRRFPYVQFVSAPFDNNILLELISQEIPFMPDKNAKDKVVFGAGAEAMGVFFVTKAEVFCSPYLRTLLNHQNTIETDNGFLMLFFDTAARKLFNRHSQAFGGSTADTADAANYPIQRSKYRYATSEGEVAVYGFTANFLITNSAFQGASGVAVARDRGLYNKTTGELGGFRRPYSITKSESNTLAPHQISRSLTELLRKKAAASGNGDRWLEALIPTIEAKLRKVVGQTFINGDALLTLFEGDPLFEAVILEHRGLNQEITVRDFEVAIDSVFYQLNIKLKTDLQGDDDCIKVRIPGGKMTLDSGFVEIERHDEALVQAFDEELGYLTSDDGEPIMISDYNQDWLDNLNGSRGWEILMPFETQKDQLIRVHAFINAMGGGAIDKNIVRLDDGNEVDLAEPGNIYEIWLEQETKLVFLKRTVARVLWDDTIARNEKFQVSDLRFGITSLVGYEILEVTDTSVTFMEPVQALYAKDMVFGMEISSAHENVTTQAMTGEMVASMSAFDYNAAAKAWDDASFYHQGVMKLVDMMTMGFSSNPEAPVFGPEDYKAIQKWIIKTDDDGRQAPRTGRDLFKFLARKYPAGFGLSVPTANGVDNPIFIIPDAIMGVAAFGNGGAATGLIKDVIDLIRSYAVDPKDRNQFWADSLRGNTARVKAGWETWSGMRPRGGMVDSKSILGKLGSSAKNMVSGKIMNSMQPELHYEAGSELPYVIFNPNCDIPRKLGVKNGDIVGLIRVPMIMPVYCKVKLLKSAKRSYATTLGFIWARGNEGDADGDGFSSFKAHMTEEKAMMLNSHVLSAGGYDYVYKSVKDQPYSEFVSYADGWGKKMLSATKVPAVVKPFAKPRYIPMIRLIAAESVKEYSDLISLHYGVAVGTSYGWCSIASFMVAELTWKGMLDVAAAIKPSLLNDEAGIEVLQRMVTQGPEFLTEKLDEEGNPIPLWDFLASKGLNDKLAVLQSAHRTHSCLSKLNAVVWRLIYEGLGLSGYTAMASLFFQAVSFMVRNETNMLVVYEVGNEFYIDPKADKATLQQAGVNGYDFLAEQFDIPREMMPLIIKLEKIRGGYRAMERYGITGGESAMTFAMYGALRRTTQGSTFVDFLSDDAEGTGYSTFNYLANNTGGNIFENPILSACVTNGVVVHKSIIDAKKRYANAQ